MEEDPLRRMRAEGSWKQALTRAIWIKSSGGAPRWCADGVPLGSAAEGIDTAPALSEAKLVCRSEQAAVIVARRVSNRWTGPRPALPVVSHIWPTGNSRT